MISRRGNDPIPSARVDHCVCPQMDKVELRTDQERKENIDALPLPRILRPIFLPKSHSRHAESASYSRMAVNHSSFPPFLPKRSWLARENKAPGNNRKTVLAFWIFRRRPRPPVSTM